jgi:ribosomal protein S27E
MTEEMICHNCDSANITIVFHQADDRATVRCGNCGTLLATRWPAQARPITR